jgi:hypothetical protein
MIDKAEKSFSFADAAFAHAEKEWESHWLNKVLRIVDWKPFEKELGRLYSQDQGRPGWNPICLFKCILLSEWNTLSDRQLEEAMDFRIDFNARSSRELDLTNNLPITRHSVYFAKGFKVYIKGCLLC